MEEQNENRISQNIGKHLKNSARHCLYLSMASLKFSNDMHENQKKLKNSLFSRAKSVPLKTAQLQPCTGYFSKSPFDLFKLYRPEVPFRKFLFL